MALLGPDALAAMLIGRGSIALANRCTDSEDTRVLAAVVVRHGPNGEVAAESAYELDLAAGESEALEPLDAAAPAPQQVEVLLRVFSENIRRMADVYLSGQASGSSSLAGWEAGLRDADPDAGPGEVEVPEIPGIIGYLREA